MCQALCACSPKPWHSRAGGAQTGSLGDILLLQHACCAALWLPRFLRAGPGAKPRPVTSLTHSAQIKAALLCSACGTARHAHYFLSPSLDAAL